MSLGSSPFEKRSANCLNMEAVEGRGGNVPKELLSPSVFMCGRLLGHAGGSICNWFEWDLVGTRLDCRDVDLDVCVLLLQVGPGQEALIRFGVVLEAVVEDSLTRAANFSRSS